jgi:hypothetical protein
MVAMGKDWQFLDPAITCRSGFFAIAAVQFKDSSEQVIQSESPTFPA